MIGNDGAVGALMDGKAEKVLPHRKEGVRRFSMLLGR